MPTEQIHPSISRRLAALLLLGMVGVAAELLLVEHHEDFDQLIPLGVLGAGAFFLLWSSLSDRRSPRIGFVLVMLALVWTGGYGTWLHYLSNAEFKLEMDPELSGWSLFSAAMFARSPPALAPGALSLLGLLGLVLAHSRTTNSSIRKENS